MTDDEHGGTASEEGGQRAHEAVFFDVDGVLIDSVARKRDRLQHILEEELEVDVPVAELIGFNRRDKYEYLTRTTNVTVSATEFARLYKNAVSGMYADEVELLVGFRDLARDLRSRGVQIGLVSAGSGDQVQTVVERFDLEEFVETVATPDVIDGRSKPHLDLYEHAADSLGMQPAQCLAVEDSEQGTTAAVSAGVYCVGYAPPENPPQDLSHADEIVTDPDVLRQRVIELVLRDTRE